MKQTLLKLSFVFYTIFLAIVIGAQARSEPSDWNDLLPQVRSTLEQAKQNIWSEI